MEQTKANPYSFQISQANLAVTFLIITFTMLFATLFMGYAIFRSNAPVWPPFNVNEVPKMGPLLSTLIMALSSLTFVLFQKYRQTLYLNLTFVFGLFFLFLQYKLWVELNQLGYTLDKGIYPSIVFAFMVIHGTHIVLALSALLWLMFQFKREKIAEKLTMKIKNVGHFWHFLGIIWLIMYLILFIV